MTSSNRDYCKDKLINQLALSINQGINSMEGMAIQSRRIEPAMIPYVITQLLRQQETYPRYKISVFSRKYTLNKMTQE
jgi:hypothetical protein